MRARTVVGLTLVALVLGVPATRADEEREACVEACEQTKAECVAACGTHDNPIECDAACQEDAQECTERCD